MFGKLMSISDELMWRYFELLSFRSLGDVAALRAAVAAGRNPRDVKFELARELVARFHDGAAAERAQQHIYQPFCRQDAAHGPARSGALLHCGERPVLASLVALTSGGVALAPSRGEARRKVAEGAVRIDGEKASDPQLRLAAGSAYTLQLGPAPLRAGRCKENHNKNNDLHSAHVAICCKALTGAAPAL